MKPTRFKIVTSEYEVMSIPAVPVLVADRKCFIHSGLSQFDYKCVVTDAETGARGGVGYCEKEALFVAEFLMQEKDYLDGRLKIARKNLKTHGIKIPVNP